MFKVCVLFLVVWLEFVNFLLFATFWVDLVDIEGWVGLVFWVILTLVLCLELRLKLWFVWSNDFVLIFWVLFYVGFVWIGVYVCFVCLFLEWVLCCYFGVCLVVFRCYVYCVCTCYLIVLFGDCVWFFDT